MHTLLLLLVWPVRRRADGRYARFAADRKRPPNPTVLQKRPAKKVGQDCILLADFQSACLELALQREKAD